MEKKNKKNNIYEETNKKYKEDNNILLKNIPKILYQVWDIDLPLFISNNNKKYLNSSYKYYRFGPSEIKDYLLNKWGQDYLNLFNNYKKIAHKVDLFRYCLLYDKGGIYLDADCLLLNNINNLIENNNCIFITNNRGVRDIFNGFLATYPKNPIFKEIIDFMIKKGTSIENDYYFNCKELYEILNKYINIKINKNDYIYNNTKICLLFDKKLNDNYFYAFLNNQKILIENNPYYPYKKN